MSTILSVFYTVCKRKTQDKKKFALLFIFPILSIVLTLAVGGIKSSNLRLAVVNKYNGCNKKMINMLDSTKGVEIVLQPEVKNAKRNVLRGEFDALIWFKDEIKIDQQDIADDVEIYNIKNKEINSQLQGILMKYLHSEDLISIKNGTKQDNNSMISFLYIILLISSVMNCVILIKDREDNILPRYLYSPNNLLEYSLGIALYNFAMAFIQSFIALFVADLMKVGNGIGYLDMLFYSVLLSAIATSLAMMLVCFFNRELMANMMAATISIILALVGGAFIPYEMMPDVLQKISKCTPNSWIISLENWKHGSYTGINPILALCLFILIFITITVMTMKKRRYYLIKVVE